MSEASANNLERILQARHAGLVGIAAVATFYLLLSNPVQKPEAHDPLHLKVDPNTVNVGVLEALPRVGPTMAARIADERDAQPFRDLDDLDARVKGVGPATRKVIAPFLIFPDDPNASAR